MEKDKPLILVVEDEALIYKALIIKLESEGFATALAEDGVEGLEKAFNLHPDLILLDIVMPRMDGLTMLARLEEDEWGKQVPVIILTNLTENNKVSEAMNKGTCDYLVKADWKLDDVIKKVKSRLDK